MDTSKVYIDMCAKSDEVQNLSVMFDPDESHLDNLCACSKHHELINDADAYIQHFIKDKETVIWLIRQDQTQELYAQWIADQLELVKSSGDIKIAFLDFASWLNKQYLPENFTCVPTNCFDSGEQLWLAFYMEKTNGKLWNDNDWIKE